MIEIRTQTEVEQMKKAGKFVAEVLQTCHDYIKPGVNLLEIDEMVKRMIFKKKATSCYVDYAPSFGDGPFGHYICLSVNDAVLHGMPYDYTLETGDLLSVDFACEVEGWVSDSAFSMFVGEKEGEYKPSVDELKLNNTVKEALGVAIDQCISGKRIGDISSSIGEFCKSRGYLVNTDFGGHGVGRIMHGDPHIPNDGKAGRGYKMRPGLVFATEPWLLMNTDEIYIDADDGWTIRSDDGSLGSHFEHTVAITDKEPIILTAWD